MNGAMRWRNWGEKCLTGTQSYITPRNAKALSVSHARTYLLVMCGRFDNLIARDAYRGLFKAQRLPSGFRVLRFSCLAGHGRLMPRLALIVSIP